MGWFDRFLGERTSEAQRLYDAAVAKGREAHWYEAGAVSDTIDGRFDMITAVVAIIMLRLETEPAGDGPAARLTECFVADMDGQMREQGIGDVVVGKTMGKLVSLLGGRLGAYRWALAAGSLHEALLRNLYRGEDPGATAIGRVAGRLTQLRRDLDDVSVAEMLEGRLP